MTKNTVFSHSVYIPIVFLFLICMAVCATSDDEKHENLSSLTFEQLVDKISNADIFWQGHDYMNPVIVGEYAIEIYHRRCLDSIPILIKALEEKDKILVAHILLTKMLMSSYKIGLYECNHFNLWAYKQRPKEVTEKIIKYWKTFPLSKISREKTRRRITKQKPFPSPPWFLEMTMKEGN